MSNNNNKIKEPLFHIAKRDALPFWQSWLIRILSIVASLIVCSIVTIVLTGENPIGVFTTLIEGAIGSERRIWSLMQNVAILLCISLICFNSTVFNTSTSFLVVLSIAINAVSLQRTLYFNDNFFNQFRCYFSVI